jgi:hypothetical protein
MGEDTLKPNTEKNNFEMDMDKWWFKINVWDDLLNVLNNVSDLRRLIDDLWFKETSELKELRSNIIGLLSEWKDYKTKYVKYADIAVALIDNWPLGLDWKKIPMFVLDLVHASIIREWWNKNHMKTYWDCIDAA